MILNEQDKKVYDEACKALKNKELNEESRILAVI
jgi:hypothetical protein